MQGKRFILCNSLANPHSQLRGVRSLIMFEKTGDLSERNYFLELGIIGMLSAEITFIRRHLDFSP
jgi:hypothetical protein